jgi:hypothetical protein
MANPYYTHNSDPVTNSLALSQLIRAQFDLIEAGFALLPDFTLNANSFITINATETGFATTVNQMINFKGDLITDGPVTFSGAFPLTVVVSAAVTLTLPTTGVLATIAGVETWTNKTFTSPVINGALTGSAQWQAGTVEAGFGGTGLATYTVGDLLYASTPTALARLASVSAGSYLRSQGVSTPPAWSVLKLPNASAQGDLFVSTVTNQVTTLSKVTVYSRYLSNQGPEHTLAWAQVNLANGVTGKLDVSHFNSGTDASQFTYWRGDGIWINPQIEQGMAFQNKVAFTTVGSTTWEVPAGVFKVFLFLWGGGGGGGGSSAIRTLPKDQVGYPGGRGSDGGHVIRIVSVNPGEIWDIVVGGGGAGGAGQSGDGIASSGSDGGPTSFSRGAFPVVADGGKGGSFGAIMTATVSVDAFGGSTFNGSGGGWGTASNTGGDILFTGKGGRGQAGGNANPPASQAGQQGGILLLY